MKIFEVIVKEKLESEDDGWTRIEQGSLTSGKDVVLSKNGAQAVRDLKLTDEEVELLKAVALGWADMSDLGNLEQDIFEYWLESNPEDFNPDLHGGGADPSDTVMDELESWFDDAVKEWSQGNKKAADKAGPGKNHPNRRWAVGEEREDDAPTIDDLARMLKLAGVKSEGIKITPRPTAPTPPTDNFSKGGAFDLKPGFGDVEGTPKPTPNVDTFGSKFHKSPNWKNIDVKPTKIKPNVSKDIDR
jgi:hypothetical protein